LLTKGKLNGIEKIENKINDMIHTDEEYLNFIKPVAAYVTFKYQNGMERCLNTFKSE